MNYLKTMVDSSTKYPVFTGTELLSKIPELLEIPASKKIAIVSDDIVFPLHGSKVEGGFLKNGNVVSVFVFKHGEESKSLENLEVILEFLSKADITRSDLVVAFGGGVVGDITGLASSLFLRGVDFIQVPTTLLAAVDSSVGGKTAVNTHFGKNNVGAFYNPKAVVCDIGCFDTLSNDIFSEGLSESIKMGMINDEKLFESFENEDYLVDRNVVDVVISCVKAKAAIVHEDEFDTGIRQLLNFGHTFGHAVEKASNHEIRHGRAVAIGMAIMTRATEKLGWTEKGTYERLEKVLLKNNLPIFYKGSILEFIKSDKKRRGDSITIVIAEKTGKCVLKKIDYAEIEKILELGM